MLMPDVTSILNDPEVGGGVSFRVIRNSSVRSKGGYTKTTNIYDETGNIQPQEMSNQASTTEDLLNESIVIFSTFAFQAGSNVGSSIVEADIVEYDGFRWRVTRVEDWKKWGYTRAYATKTMDVIVPIPVEEQIETPVQEGDNDA